jgi:hypothetical protein
MNELELITSLDDTTDPSGAAMDAAFERLVAEIRREGAVRPTRWGTAKKALIGAAGVAAAAASAAVLVATAPFSAHRDGETPGAQAPSTLATSPAPTSSASPTTPPAPPAMPEAAAVLHKAAAAATAVSAPLPAGSQFLYVTDSNGYEAWLSIDGTQDGLITTNGTTIQLPACVDGIALVPGNSQDPRPQPCTPQPALLADAPTTAEAMADYIVELATPGSPGNEPLPDPSTNSLGKQVNSLLTTSYLLPAARAALFEAIPLLPGLQISAETIPGQARELTSVSWTFGPSSVALVFDASSFEFLGYRTTGAQPQLAPSSGGDPQPTEIIGVTRQFIVDSVGARP